MRRERLSRFLHDLGRGMVGALIVAASFLYTMETWWLGWTLPAWLLVTYAVVGVALVALVVRSVGFRERERGKGAQGVEILTDTLELVLQSVLAAFAVLLIFGVLEITDPAVIFSRMGMMQLVPLSFGAGVANRALAGSEGKGAAEKPFPQDVALVAGGVLYFALAIAPTEEMVLMATRASWWRLALVIPVSLVLAYLILFELEFRGQAGRRLGLTPLLQVGETFLVYTTALVLSAVLLFLFGQFHGMSPVVWVQETIVLSLLSTIGGSAARVVF